MIQKILLSLAALMLLLWIANEIAKQIVNYLNKNT